MVGQVVSRKRCSVTSYGRVGAAWLVIFNDHVTQRRVELLRQAREEVRRSGVGHVGINAGYQMSGGSWQ